MSDRKGFTLIEMLVVISIILLLAAFVVMLITQMVDRARFKKCQALVEKLDAGCKTYRVDYGIFPPSSGTESKVLHKALGSKRKIKTGHGDDGFNIFVERPPIIEFHADDLDLTGGRTDLTPNPEVEIIDPWGRAIFYIEPGVSNIGLFDIWSTAKDVTDDLDNVTNWNKDT